MPRPDVSDQRKTEILNAARKIFSHQSFESVKMQEIARAAGLSVGGVYWYFKSKDEVLGTLLLQNAENNIAALKALNVADAPAAQRLQAFFEQVLSDSEQVGKLYLTGAKYHAMLSSEPATRAVIQRISTGYRTGLTTLIEQGIARGEFHPLNATGFAYALIGMYEGAMLLWVISPDTMWLKETMQTAMQVMMAGLMTK